MNDREAKNALANCCIFGLIQLTIRQQTNALQNILDDNRLEYVQLSTGKMSGKRYILNQLTYFKLAHRPTNADCGLIAHYLSCHHCDSFALCRVDFSGHDAATRLVLW